MVSSRTLVLTFCPKFCDLVMSLKERDEEDCKSDIFTKLISSTYNMSACPEDTP